MRRARVVAAVVVALSLAAGLPEAWMPMASARPWCRGPAVVPGFGYGNAGYAAGYSMQVGRWAGCRPWDWGSRWGSRWGWGGGWCGTGWGWNPGPVYRPFCRPPVWGRPGWSFGNPCFGSPWIGGWYGATRFRGCDSVFLSVPAGGGGSFFSGSVVPFPVYGSCYPGWGYPATWLPGCFGTFGGGVYCAPYGGVLPSNFAPQFGPAGVLPYLGAGVATPPTATGGVANVPVAVVSAAPVAGRGLATRVSNAAARLRAARLVAIGDRHLRESGRDPARLRAALDSYSRAATIAQDQPDTFVRQAIALVALDRRDLADKAIDRAVALDGRLAASAPAPAGEALDPVFDSRSTGGPSALAVRGTAILREIAGREAGTGDAGQTIARLAARWSDRWANGLNAVAATTTRSLSGDQGIDGPRPFP